MIFKNLGFRKNKNKKQTKNKSTTTATSVPHVWKTWAIEWTTQNWDCIRIVPSITHEFLGKGKHFSYLLSTARKVLVPKIESNFQSYIFPFTLVFILISTRPGITLVFLSLRWWVIVGALTISRPFCQKEFVFAIIIAVSRSLALLASSPLRHVLGDRIEEHVSGVRTECLPLPLV